MYQYYRRVNQYYYTVASLPQLSYQMEKIPSVDEFIEICEESLSKNDFKLLKTAVIDDLEPRTVKNQILNTWYIWERNLRNNLVQLRAKRKNVDPQDFERENPDLFHEEKLAREAFEHDSPLTAEDILNWERWSYLEELELGHYFDTDKVLIYYLKLQLLTRIKSFNKEKGTEKFNSIIENIKTMSFSQDSEEQENVQ